MNAVATVETPRAVPLRAKMFRVFKVTPGCDKRNGKDLPLGGRTYDRGDLKAATLEEAIAEAVSDVFFDHKETLVIRETGFDRVQWANVVEERPVDRLHIFKIKKKSAARYTWKGNIRGYERSNDLYPDPLCTIDAQAMFGLTGDSLFHEERPEGARLSRG